MDYPREELMRKAEEALELHPNARVYFKYTCNRCGNRVMFREANTVYAEGECECGHVQPFTQGGFALEVPLGNL